MITPAGALESVRTQPPAEAARAQGSEDAHAFSVMLRLRDGFQQDVDFGVEGAPLLLTDEPAPLGEGEGPNPARLLASAVGSCLAASLLFCLRKARVEVKELETTVMGTLIRNERGRFRIGELRVALRPTVAAADRPRLARCLEVFEDFCIVTESVRSGIEVGVDIDSNAA